jgi:hemerythrin-like domain-containing protein
MNDPMRILKADHREVERLLKRLADTDEGNERNKLAREVQMKLTSHMEIEESIVYPPVSEEVGEEDREEAETEHRLARQGLETMMSMLEQPGFGASVQMLLGGITHHVEEEERELLPELRDALDRDEWLAMGDAIAAAKEAAGLPVPAPSSRRSSKRRGRSSGAARASESKRRSSGNSKSAASTSTPKKSTAKKSTAKKTSANKTPAKKTARSTSSSKR